MRIDAYAQVQQLYSNNHAQKMQKDIRASVRDQLQISSKGKDIQTAKNAVANATDVRENLVETLKKAVNAGTYEVSGDKFAQKMFERYDSTYLGSF